MTERDHAHAPKVFSDEEIEMFLAGDRRQIDRHMLYCLNRIAAVLIKHTEKEDAFHDSLAELGKVESAMSELDRRVRALNTQLGAAFPCGDYEGHRRAHDAMIKRTEAQTEFWHRMRIKAGELTVWAFLTCLAAVLVYYWNGHVPSVQQISTTK